MKWKKGINIKYIKDIKSLINKKFNGNKKKNNK